MGNLSNPTKFLHFICLLVDCWVLINQTIKPASFGQRSKKCQNRLPKQLNEEKKETIKI